MGNGIRPSPPPFRTLFKSVKVIVQSSPVANAASLLKDFGNSYKETISACCKDLSSFSKAICIIGLTSSALVGFFLSLCLSSSKVYSDYFAFRRGLLIEVREECLTKVNKSIVTPIMYLWHLLHYQQ